MIYKTLSVTAVKLICFSVMVRAQSIMLLHRHTDTATTQERNILYTGIDNPVIISSPAPWENTSIAISGGRISGSGAERIVRVAEPGVVTITMTADGKSFSFDFIANVIPDLVIKIGPGGSSMEAALFRNQRFCRAESEGTGIQFKVAGARVYFSGAGFSKTVAANLKGNDLSSLKSYMDRCVKGTRVLFDEVKVEGPDGLKVIQGLEMLLY